MSNLTFVCIDLALEKQYGMFCTLLIHLASLFVLESHANREVIATCRFGNSTKVCHVSIIGLNHFDLGGSLSMSILSGLASFPRAQDKSNLHDIHM